MGEHAELIARLEKAESGKVLNQPRPLYDHDNRHNDQDQLDDQADGRIDTRQQAAGGQRIAPEPGRSGPEGRRE